MADTSHYEHTERGHRPTDPVIPGGRDQSASLRISNVLRKLREAIKEGATPTRTPRPQTPRPPAPRPRP